MNATENFRWQVFAAECGFAFEILFTIFCGFFGYNLPPAAPSLTAEPHWAATGGTLRGPS
jgi:hypothetical protein